MQKGLFYDDDDDDDDDDDVVVLSAVRRMLLQHAWCTRWGRKLWANGCYFSVQLTRLK